MMAREQVFAKLVATTMMKVTNKIGSREKGESPEAYKNAHVARILPVAKARVLDAAGIVSIVRALSNQEGLNLHADFEKLSALGLLKATVQKTLSTRDDQIAWMTEEQAAEHGRPLIRRQAKNARFLSSL